MAESNNPSAQGTPDAKGAGRERIDTAKDQDLRNWARKLDATPEQIREAIDAVGDSADRVELHLKGSRSTTNSERVEKTKER